jgi:hypothetical protein
MDKFTAVLAPVLVGVNVTLTAQLSPGSNVAAQFVVLANWLEWVLLAMTIDDSDKSVVPLLLTVKTCAALVVLISWLPKDRLEEDKPRIALVPDPLSETPVGLLAPLWTTDRVAVLAPVLVGVNVTFTTQFAPGAIDAAQVVVRENCPLSVPVKVIAAAPPPANTRLVVPVLLRVIDCAALVVLIG